jgi:hypothetical protein
MGMVRNIFGFETRKTAKKVKELEDKLTGIKTKIGDDVVRGGLSSSDRLKLEAGLAKRELEEPIRQHKKAKTARKIDTAVAATPAIGAAYMSHSINKSNKAFSER